MMENFPIVPGSTIAAMFAASFLCIVLPIVLMLVLHKKNGTKFAYFFIGCAAFFVFALFLESVVHNIVLLGLPIGKIITGNIWFYGLYGGLMAGLFEETGRLVAFKTLMRKSNKLSDSLMYGAGHGGVESILVAGVSVAEYAVFCIMSNAGMLSDILSAAGGEAGDEAAAQLGTIITQYAGGGVLLPALSFSERVSAVAFHVAASVLVFIAAKRKDKGWLYPLAVFLHAAFDFVAVVAASYISNLVIVETILLACSALFCVFTGLFYRKEKGSDKTSTEEAVATA